VSWPGRTPSGGLSRWRTVWQEGGESLAGRAGFVEVWPSTQGEAVGAADRFIDALFAGPGELGAHRPSGLDRRGLLERVCTGGYPAVHRLPARQRPGWFRDYVRTTIERDVVELSGIRKVVADTLEQPREQRCDDLEEDADITKDDSLRRSRSRSAPSR